MNTKFSETEIWREIKMLSEKIKKYIANSGYKINAIAERAGLPANTFSAMINGKRKITAEEYFAICKALGVALDYFTETA